MIPRFIAFLRRVVEEGVESAEEEDVPMRTSEPPTATETHPVWKEITPELHRHEFRHPDKMAPDFLRLMSKIRRESGVPFRIVSDYRSPENNPGSSRSAHMEEPCRAVDLRVLTNDERYRLVTTALAHDITRIGIYPPNEWQQKTFGRGSGSVHIDASPVNVGKRIWMSW